MSPPDTQFDKLTDGNYYEWKIYMEALLTRKNLLNYIDGSERHPGGNEGTKKVRDFHRKQQEARAEIILNISASQLAHCRDADPMIIWNNLITIHSSRGRSTIIALQCQFHHLQLEHSETMSAYIACVHHIAFLLTEAKVKISDDDLILAITSGLPHLYDSFLISLDATPDDEFTLNNITAHLINKYQRQHMYSTSQCPPAIDSTPDEAMSITLTSSKLLHITYFTCGNKGHYQANCPTHVSMSTASRPTSSTTKPKEFAGLVTEDSDSDEAF